MTPEMNPPENKEILNPENIFILSPVFQPKWKHPSKRITGSETSDNRRGDLIIENLKKASEIGYSVVLIYSSKDGQDFINALKEAATSNGKNSIVIEQQQETTYSGSRRDAIREAQKLHGKVRVMYEIEKPIDAIPDIVQPLLDGKAKVSISDRQIVVNDNVIDDRPACEGENFRGLPDRQARSEHAFSVWANDLLKHFGIMPKDFPFVDWMGNRAWIADPKIDSIFLARYETVEGKEFLGTNPDHLSSSLFYPLAMVFKENIPVVSIPINYQHDPGQTALENASKVFRKKRDDQRNMLKAEMIQFIKLIEGYKSAVRQSSV